MKDWKKAGLTALAGSLVATSAFAGAVTVSGTANLTYTANGGQEDTGEADEGGAHDGNRWGINKTLSFSGSGELDNGWPILKVMSVGGTRYGRLLRPEEMKKSVSLQNLARQIIRY